MHPSSEFLSVPYWTLRWYGMVTFLQDAFSFHFPQMYFYKEPEISQWSKTPQCFSLFCEIKFPTRQFNNFSDVLPLVEWDFSSEVCKGLHRSSILPIHINHLVMRPVTQSQDNISVFRFFSLSCSCFLHAPPSGLWFPCMCTSFWHILLLPQPFN